MRTNKIDLLPVFEKLVLGCFFGLGLGFALGHGAIWWKKVKFSKKKGGKRHKKVLAYESARFKAKSQTEKPNSA